MIIDDCDRCEWVNVSSGTSSPGCPGQNPESRKTVLVVVGAYMIRCAGTMLVSIT